MNIKVDERTCMMCVVLMVDASFHIFDITNPYMSSIFWWEFRKQFNYQLCK